LTGADQDPGGYHPEDKAADVGEEGDAAAVRGRTEEAEVGLDELVEEPGAEEEHGRQLCREDDDEPAHGRVRIENEVGAEHGGDRAAGAQVRHAGLRRRAEEERYRGLRQGRGEATGKVEDEVAERAEG